uniref:Pilus assembly protein n=1 Tax=Heterorhabditis bacteriophora TaxID=37862 RepID=A0A1I7XPI1_HETBA
MAKNDASRSTDGQANARDSNNDTSKDLLRSRTGGAYIPPAKLKLMQEKISDKDRSSHRTDNKESSNRREHVEKPSSHGQDRGRSSNRSANKETSNRDENLGRSKRNEDKRR